MQDSPRMYIKHSSRLKQISQKKMANTSGREVMIDAVNYLKVCLCKSTRFAARLCGAAKTTLEIVLSFYPSLFLSNIALFWLVKMVLYSMDYICGLTALIAPSISHKSSHVLANIILC